MVYQHQPSKHNHKMRTGIVFEELKEVSIGDGVNASVGAMGTISRISTGFTRRSFTASGIDTRPASGVG